MNRRTDTIDMLVTGGFASRHTLNAARPRCPHWVTSDELRPIVKDLDALSRIRGQFYAGKVGRKDTGSKPGLSAKTAANIWAEVTSAFREASSSKIDSLLVRKDNPAGDGVQGPDTGDHREQAALYPSELTALLSRARVPAWRRRLYAVCAYAGLRSREVRGLLARDVDFDHGVIVVRRQRRGGAQEATKQTKTQAAKRTIPIDPELVALLKVLVEEAGDGQLVKMPPAEDCAERLRVDLRTAEINREELHTDDEERMHFTLHGLRHTAITHWAVAGKPMQWIQAAAGHTDWQTTQRYLDKAIGGSGAFGKPHPPIPAAIPDRTTFGQVGQKWSKSSRISVTPMGIEPMFPT